MSDNNDIISRIIDLSTAMSTANGKLDNIREHLTRNDVAFLKITGDVDDIEKKLQEVEASLKTLRENVDGIKEEKKAKRLARESFIGWVGSIIGGSIVLLVGYVIEWWSRQ